ncbi:hypothetical protein KPL47_14575, partial [Clostridium estertheticum]|uniref:hypothetical protein n=1 Tax=Clostridium estertheticum TaxID=238834 RepID=UPI001C0E411C
LVVNQLYQIRECSSAFFAKNADTTGYRLEKSYAKVELLIILNTPLSNYLVSLEFIFIIY